MNTKLFLLFTFLVIFNSCSKELSEETIIKAVINNNSNKIYDSFYKRHRINKDNFAIIVKQYSDALKSKKLNQIPFRDEWDFKKRPRSGYLFVDDNNNLHYSITFKYSEMKDGEKLLNFIDFRASEDDIQCIKFPSQMPLKGTLLPKTKPPSPKQIDSLQALGPTIISGVKIYPEFCIDEKYLASHGDTLNWKVISLNFGNKFIRDNVQTIISELGKKIDLSQYIINRYENYAQPTIYLAYDREFPEPAVLAIKNVLLNTGAKVKLKSYRGFGNKIKSLSIGAPNSEAKLKCF